MPDRNDVETSRRMTKKTEFEAQTRKLAKAAKKEGYIPVDKSIVRGNIKIPGGEVCSKKKTDRTLNAATTALAVLGLSGQRAKSA
ncbi:hypothetical protein [Terasakiella sp. SH-1]|uniref:hypothetical protein n=1 Tax=Terasakiella sp. SH-1 TaxID=2560057 RepID=UPI00107303A2|nr:hypothetical protein [Terasakiella sp. SH-1]